MWSRLSTRRAFPSRRDASSKPRGRIRQGDLNPSQKARIQARSAVNRLTRLAIRDELTRKRLIVAHSNLRYLVGRKSLDLPALTDVDAVLLQRHFPVREMYRGNAFYGISEALKAFAELDEPINACIEHGVYFGDYVNPLEAEMSGLPAVITFSETRKMHLAATTHKPIFPIGPYIWYAKPYLDKSSSEELRRQLGRVLLVFPTHSLDAIGSHFDVAQFIRSVDNFTQTHSFDHVLVCIYWRDYELGMHSPYLEHGYGVASAGRRGDPRFLPRLRSLIELSSHTISNSVGTHVGYSVSLGRGHTILPQQVQFRHLASGDLGGESLGGSHYRREQEQAEVLAAFDQYMGIVSEDQLDVVDKYWGLRLLRSQGELRSILETCQRAASQ